MKGLTARAMVLTTATALFSFASTYVYSQTDAAASPSSTQSEKAKPTKAQRKAARKEVRAKKNQELKKLEGTGYNPAVNDNNYPQDLQNAEKKAAASQGGTQ